MRTLSISWRLLCCAFLLAITTTVMSFAQSITLSAKAGPPTLHVAVSGAGFPAYSAIDIYFDTTDVALTAASGTGTFTKVPLQVPPSALPGTHYITAVARSNSTSAQLGFLVSTSWAQFGFAPTNQRYNPYENVLAPWNASQLDLAWVFPNGLIYGNPVEAGGVLFVGSYDASLYAINAATGKTIWSFGTGSVIAGTPAVAGGNVYFGSADGNIYALKAANGALLWSYATGGGVFNSVMVANGAVYVGVGQTLLAIDAKNGSLLWSFVTSGSIGDQVAAAYGMVYVDGGGVYALNASSGSLVWSAGLSETSGAPVVSKAIVYVNIPGDFHSFGGFSALNGSLASLNSAPCNTYTAGNGILYQGFDSYIQASNPSSNFFWQYATSAPVNSTAAVADGVVLEGADDGNLYALDSSSGSYLWNFNFGFGTLVRASPIVANGMVFLSGPDRNLYAFALPAPAKQIQAPKISQLHPDPKLTALRSH